MTQYAIDHRHIVPVTEDADSYEELGTKAKVWLGSNRYLFKQGRPGTGEDWSEVVVSALCDLLGLPHAKYCFAVDKYHTPGILTESIVPPGARLVHGNELMSGYRGYNPEQRFKLKAYTLKRVFALLSLMSTKYGLQSPLSVDDATWPPTVYFAGYLLLDVLIGNQDRHHENWGIILHENTLYLAETFDHASSLGRNDSDEKKRKILEKHDARLTIKEYCARAKTPFYTHKEPAKQMKTLEAYALLCTFMDGPTGDVFLSKVTEEALTKIFDELPKDALNGPSELSARFAIAMIMQNKQRLREGM